MKEFFERLSAFGANLDDTVLGALLGVTITCLVTWAGHLVTHTGARTSNRIARAEKRAVLAVRDLSSTAGSGFGGRLLNLGPTAACDVGLDIDGDSLSLGAIGAGEGIDFQFRSAIVGDARLTLRFRDFADGRRREVFRVEEANGVVCLRPNPSFLARWR